MLIKIPEFPDLPARISRLPEFSFNLWWSWHSRARELFRRLDLTLWRRTHHNPVRMLHEINSRRLAQRAADPRFLALYDSVISAYDDYLQSNTTWYREAFPDSSRSQVAYLCAEFGLHNSLPIYSGGLGLLAGDTCKEASDLGIPLIGVGALYPEGYFHQKIEADGRQVALYTRLDTTRAPLLPVLNDEGERLLVDVPLDDTVVKVALWRVMVGRVPIFLMDTDIEENDVWLRDVTARLYGGDQLVRLRQEIILGIGGIRCLTALGYDPDVYHLNEGHASFAAVELLRRRLEAGDSFQAALKEVKQQLVFTTHTPVKAGHDEFPFHMMEEYFHHLWEEMGVNRESFLELGQIQNRSSFSMTVLALKTARQANAVSRKHGEVSREMWAPLWPEREVQDVPIISVTNGVHVPTWVAAEMVEHFESHIGPYWWMHHDDPHLWERVLRIPDKDLWETHMLLKAKLLTFVREAARYKWAAGGVSSTNQLVALGTLLDGDVLTIGFARRFATYKRAGLILRDRDRLRRLLTHSRRPVQIIFSGKAHPADEEGKYVLQQVFEACASPDLEGRMAFVEDYNKHVAHYLISGVDVWLNNPAPPLEASGTSGQKASLNGIPNLSVRDGWWYEGHNGRNGWSIEGEDDDATASHLYELLEDEIVPLFYKRDSEGVPRQWTAVMKEAIRSISAEFSARRMMKEYARKLYQANGAADGRREEDSKSMVGK